MAQPKSKRQLKSVLFIMVGALIILCAVTLLLYPFLDDSIPDSVLIKTIALVFVFLGLMVLVEGIKTAHRQKLQNEDPKTTLITKEDTYVKEQLDGIITTSRRIQKEQIICPTCHKPNDFDSPYCMECGIMFQKTCKHCHTQNRIQATYCDSCGEKF